MGEDDDRCERCGLPSIECFDYDCPHDSAPTSEPRTTPARDYRIRIHTDRIDGPIWLRLLATLGYALGVAGDDCYGIAT
jgi:hypothetical protein